MSSGLRCWNGWVIADSVLGPVFSTSLFEESQVIISSCCVCWTHTHTHPVVYAGHIHTYTHTQVR
jgi:hypothetical protein